MTRTERRGEGSVTGENLPSVSYTACSTGRKDTLMMGFLYSSISSDTRLIYVNSISCASLSGGSTASAADLLSLMMTFTTCLILSGTSTNPTTPSTITASTASLERRSPPPSEVFHPRRRPPDQQGW